MHPRDTGTPATLVYLLRSAINIFAEQCDLTPHVFSIYPCFLQQVRTAIIFLCAYWQHFLAQESGFGEATTDRVVHAASLFALDGTCRARHTSNYHHQSILRSPSKSSSSLTEGRRAFLTAIFMRHLQRVIDALPSDSQVPPTDVNTYLPLECTHSCLTLSCCRQASVMRISVSSAVLSSVHCTDCLSLVHKKRFSCPSCVGIDFKRRADLDI